jgi:UDP-glucose 4-epimerase
MHVLVTGGTGALGRFIVPALIAGGHSVTLLGRSPVPGTAHLAWRLGEPAALPPAGALVHLAFDHLPGLFRGGEGEDPARFRRLNQDGTRALFDAAQEAGIPRLLFLSSRAVYGDHRRGDILRETDAPAPDSLYGALKLACERDLLARAGPDFTPVALRATGIYGCPPGSRRHKWEGLFADFLAGRAISPRQATELHGEDLAAAIPLLLEAPPRTLAPGMFDASDILLDRHDLLAAVQARTGCPHPTPPPAEGPPPGAMECRRLRAMGWLPGGTARLERFLDTLFPPA